MATKEQLDDFYSFASHQVDNGGAQLSMDDLYFTWRARHPTAHELADSVAALNAAYADVQAGERGRPARVALRETCRELGLVIDE